MDNGKRVTVFDGTRPFDTSERRGELKIVGCSPGYDGLPAWLRRRAGIGHLVAPWYFSKAVRAVHREDPIDLIEATNWYAPAYFLRGSGIPLVVRNSTPAIDAASNNASVRNRFDLRFAHRLERKTAIAADATISNTRSHGTLIGVLYAGIDVERHHIISLALAPDTLVRGAATSWPPDGAARTVVFVGRAERRKGYREALEGFAHACTVMTDDPSPGLHVVGIEARAVDSDPELSSAIAPARDRITFHPKVSDELLHELYGSASAVLAPSRYESFGLVYREAAAFGRPLVACAEDPAAVEFIRSARCGLLADTCTAQDVGAALVDVLTNQKQAAIFHENGITHARSLTRATLARETLAVYEKAIAEAARRQGV